MAGQMIDVGPVCVNIFKLLTPEREQTVAHACVRQYSIIRAGLWHGHHDAQSMDTVCHLGHSQPAILGTVTMWVVTHLDRVTTWVVISVDRVTTWRAEHMRRRVTNVPSAPPPND
eukprot:364344-Chlamydomonas_euryale.AAC.28